MLPALVVLLRHVLVGRIGMIILSAIVAHVAWHWMIERGDVLWKVEWPQLDGPGLAVLARWVAGLLLAAAGVRFFARRARMARGTALPSLGGDELAGGSRRRSGVSARM